MRKLMKSINKKHVIWLVVFVVLAAAAYRWRQGQSTLKLDNAFVTGHVIRMAAPIAGVIETIDIGQADNLHRGATAFVIAGSAAAEHIRSAELALQASFFDAGQECKRLETQNARVKLSGLATELAGATAVDALTLSAQGYVSKRYLEQQQNKEKAARISHQIDQLEERRLAQGVGSRVPQSLKVVSAIESLRLALVEKELTNVSLDANVFVQDVHVVPGQWVDVGAPLATVIPVEEPRIQANIIESQIDRVKIGQAVEVRIDGAPDDAVLRGYVEAIVPATAAVFSQVQRNIADSTWMKVSQRIPVLVRLELDDQKTVRPRIGQSAEVILLATMRKPAPVGATHRVSLPANQPDRSRRVRLEMDERILRARDEVRRRLALPSNCSLFGG